MSEPPPPAPKKSLLRRVLLFMAIGVGLAGIAVIVGAAMLYEAATATPPEYEALLTQLADLEASGELDEQRQALESQVAALYSEAQSAPRWQSVITADQINGWLAMQLPVDLPELESQGIRMPRVILSEGVAMLACQAKVRGVDTVVAVHVAPMVADDGWAGVALESIRVGRLPLPHATLTDLFDTALQDTNAPDSGLRYRWAEADGNPALLFDVEHMASTVDQVRRIDQIEVREGELLIGGATESRVEASDGEQPTPLTGPAAGPVKGLEPTSLPAPTE